MNCVFTEKGTQDLKAIIRLKRLAERGVSVGVFPEGDRGWDGRTDILNRNLPRLIRALGIPLRVARVCGGYLTGPRWAVPNVRTGRVKIELETLGADEINRMDDEALYGYLSEKLDSNDIKNPQLKDTVFQGENLASGIHNLLWLCPECGAHDTVAGEGDEITCSACGRHWTLDGWCGVAPASGDIRDIQDWNNLQLKTLRDWRKAADTDSVHTVSESVELRRFTGHGRQPRHSGRVYSPVGTGKLELRRDLLSFVPDDASGTLEFPVEEVRNYVEGLNVELGFHFRGDRYKVTMPESNRLRYFHYFRIWNGFYESAGDERFTG